MMDFGLAREIRHKTKNIFMTARPHPIMTGAAYYVILWIISVLNDRLSGMSQIIYTAETTAEQLANMMAKAASQVTGFAIGLMILLQLVSWIVGFGFNSYSLSVASAEECGPSSLMDGFLVPGKVILIRFMVGLMVLLGSVLFIIPGVILYYRYSQALFLLCDHPDWSAVKCLRESAVLMKGRKLRLLSLHLSLIGWFIVSLMPVTSVYTSPYINICEALFYRDISPEVSGLSMSVSKDDTVL